MQDEAIHTIAGKQLWAATIEGKPNQTNPGSNKSFPTESGGYENPSVATATPRLSPYKRQA
jgi:hypothetical protein